MATPTVPNELFKSYSRFQVRAVISQGAFGTAYAGKNTRREVKKLAIKEIRVKEGEESRIMEGVEFLKTMSEEEINAPHLAGRLVIAF
jgi:hypothetical protein